MQRLTRIVLLAVLPLAALSASVGLGWACARVATSTDARGVFVTTADSEPSRFVPWTEEAVVQAELNRIVAAGGGQLRFAPGDYEIAAGFRLDRASGVTISGAPGARLYFAPEPSPRPTTTAPVARGARTIELDDPGAMRAGRAYQLYPASLKGDRILEFRVARIEGRTAHLVSPAHYMGHVKDIPAGSVVVDEVNFFRVMNSDDVTIEGLHLDGLGRGDVHGHTTYCGIYVVGVHRAGQRPTSRGLTVRHCRLSGLMGRGVCVYSMADVLIEGCTISSVDSQGIELDHFTTGRVVGNHVSDAGVGVALNDAFDSVVEANVIVDCANAVGFVRHFSEPEFNRGNVIQDNVVLGGNVGINFQPGFVENIVRRNRFGGLARDRWIRGGEGNVVEGNEGRD